MQFMYNKVGVLWYIQGINKTRYDKTNKMSVRLAKTQISNPPSLIRVFAVRLVGS